MAAYAVAASELTGDMDTIIQKIVQYNERNGDYPLTGAVPRDSVLGRLVRLRWVSFTNQCKPECWDLHCPSPDTHMRKFRATVEGVAAAARLDDTRVMRTTGG